MRRARKSLDDGRIGAEPSIEVYCTQATAGLFPGPITSTDNRFGTIECALQTFTAGN